LLLVDKSSSENELGIFTSRRTINTENKI